MKKFVLMLALVLAVTTLSGCGKDEAPSKPKESPAPSKPDYTDTYSGILEEYYNLIQNPNVDVDYDEGKLGVVEMAQYLGNEAFGAIGYLFKDINEDDVPELLIGDARTGEEAYAKNNLYAVFTIKNNKPVYVLEGRSRSAYSLMDNGHFYYHGSNGAAYTIFGEYALSKNAELKSTDFYFSYPTDTDMLDVRFYHNTTGVYDPAAAEEMSLSDEAFWAIQDKIAANTVLLDFTPFSEFTPENGGQPTPTTSPRPMVPPFCGEWTCTVSLDGSPYVLSLSLATNKTAKYLCGPQESENMVDCKGEWSWDENSITLKLHDRIEGGDLAGTYGWEMQDNTLKLKHESGDSFIYSMTGSTFTFYRK